MNMIKWDGFNERHFEKQNKGIDKDSPENSSENNKFNLKNKQNLNPLSEVKKIKIGKFQ